MRRTGTTIAGVFVASLSLIVILKAPASVRPAASGRDVEQVGTVNFPCSCAPTVQADIDKGVALLHSFQYEEARHAFASAFEQDGQCAIAEWGSAMALYHPLWDFPTIATLAMGRKQIERAQELGAHTNREREYIAAAAAFYTDGQLSHKDRTQAYSAGLQKLYQDNPTDVDAGAFYALSLVALAQDGDDDLANRKKAIAILDPLFAKQPGNPGVAHYLIHAADTPELALEGLPAARAYAKIAPDSSHALHMPSHIFRRLGLWQEMIDSNVAAVAAAAEATQAHRGDASYQFHPMDFLDYAYLQSGQETKARRLVDAVKSVPGATAEDIANHEAMFSARNAIELHRWTEAASLTVPRERLIWQDTTYWARAIGAARSGDAKSAHQDLARLREIVQARQKHDRDLGNEVVAGEAVDQSEAEGWVAFADGRPEEAVKKLKAAADREDSEHGEPFAGPAREMLADLLLELKEPSESLVEYRAVLKEYPNRFDALYGAAHAAKSDGNLKAAQEYYAKLVTVSAPAADRPELREARQYVASNRN
jgi:tetratricopeptide (TPR) repeat protein